MGGTSVKAKFFLWKIRTKKRCKEVSRSVSPMPFVEQYKVGTRENVANEERTLGYKPREKSASVSISLSLISTQAKASAAGTSRAINLTLRNYEPSQIKARLRSLPVSTSILVQNNKHNQVQKNQKRWSLNKTTRGGWGVDCFPLTTYPEVFYSSKTTSIPICHSLTNKTF